MMASGCGTDPLHQEDLKGWDPRQEDYERCWRPQGTRRAPSSSSQAQQSVMHRPRGLYVRNVPTDMSSDELKRLFGKNGKVESVVMGRAREGVSNWAIVNPKSTRDAIAMLDAFNGTPPLDLDVTLALTAEEKKQRQRERETQEQFLKEVRKDMQSTPTWYTSVSSNSDESAEKTPVVTTAIITTTSTSTTISTTSTSTGTSTTTTSASSHHHVSHHKANKGVFEAGCGVVLVGHRPAEPCVLCGTSGKMVCSVCEAWYCGIACQTEHWPQHRIICTPTLTLTPAPHTPTHPPPVAATPPGPGHWRRNLRELARTGNAT